MHLISSRIYGINLCFHLLVDYHRVIASKIGCRRHNYFSSARQSKISLPGSCFKIHSPQTTQHAEGYLPVQSLENEFSKKFYAATNQHFSDAKHPIHKHLTDQLSPTRSFDAFFDYNLGLWVQSLDPYLDRLDSNPDILTDYIGLKWHSPSPIDRTFYSLIIHSPASQKVYELMSFNEPDLSQYPNLRSTFTFKETNELRASFLAYNIDAGEFPWNREDGADLVPIKISYGCSNLDENVEFYTNVLEAEVLYQKKAMISIMDGHQVSFAFLKPKHDKLEIAYFQRPEDYTYGAFTTKVYSQLLIDTV